MMQTDKNNEKIEELMNKAKANINEAAELYFEAQMLSRKSDYCEDWVLKHRKAVDKCCNKILSVET